MTTVSVNSSFAAASYRIFQRFCTLSQLVESVQHSVSPYVADRSAGVVPNTVMVVNNYM